MLTRQEGLTKTYNRFHDPHETSADIVHLRQLHKEMDEAVACAYGWHNLDLGHGFHETKQGLRFCQYFSYAVSFHPTERYNNLFSLS
jgi:hypothetical protein